LHVSAEARTYSTYPIKFVPKKSRQEQRAAEMALAMRNSLAATSPRFLRAARGSTRAASRHARAVQARAFTVTLKTPDGDQKVEVDEDTYILDAAEACLSNFGVPLCSLAPRGTL
jgi:hypothetical protein